MPLPDPDKIWLIFQNSQVSIRTKKGKSSKKLGVDIRTKGQTNFKARGYCPDN